MRNVIFVTLLFANLQSMGQVSTPFNTFAFPTDYIGWNVTAGSPPLHIKTELAKSINFYTFAGNGTFNNLRMVIFDGPLSPFNAGFVGSTSGENNSGTSN